MQIKCAIDLQVCACCANIGISNPENHLPHALLDNAAKLALLAILNKNIMRMVQPKNSRYAIAKAWQLHGVASLA